MIALYWIFGILTIVGIIAKIAITPTEDVADRLGVAIGCSLNGVVAWLLLAEAMSR